MTERERQILSLIRDDPMMSQQEIARQLGISRSAVAGHIMNLTEKGHVKGRGYIFSDAPFIAIIGGANIDIHGSPAAKLRLHDSNPGTVLTSPGGVARNIAENLTRLGVDSRLIAAVGDDPHGQLLLEHGRAAGIDIRNVLRLESAQTSTYLSMLDDRGDLHVGVSDMDIIDHLGPERLRPHTAMLKQAELIVVDTNLNEDALAYLTEELPDREFFVDTVSTTKAQRIRPFLSSVNTLKPSLIEAEALAGFEARTDGQLRGLANWFHNEGVKRLFITLGERGVYYSTENSQGIEKLIPARSEIANAGGAGDAFMAGLAYSRLNQWPLLKSVRFSLSAASLALVHEGTNNPALNAAAVNRIYKSQYAS